MTCDDVRSRLSAYLDDELPAAEAQAVAAHLATCADCAAEYEELQLARERVRSDLPTMTAPDVLRARIMGDVRRTPQVAVASVSARRWRAAAAAAVLFVAGGGATFAALRVATGRSDDAVVAAHVRSMMAGHLTDVASTEQHTVKPWFAGKVDFSPMVPRLDSLEFPLVGGRIDSVDTRPVAALVYKRRQHVIDVFVWTASAAEPSSTLTSDLRGYNSMRWTARGLRYAAVSDLNAVELAQFVGYFREAR